jgi:hypothetical protein
MSVLDSRHPRAVCCGAHARVWRRIRFMGQAWTEFVFSWIDISKQVTATR